MTLDGALPVYDLVADLLWQSDQIKEYTVGAEHTFAAPSLPPLRWCVSASTSSPSEVLIV